MNFLCFSQVYNTASSLVRLDASASISYVVYWGVYSTVRVRFHIENSNSSLYGFTASYYLIGEMEVIK